MNCLHFVLSYYIPIGAFQEVYIECYILLAFSIDVELINFQTISLGLKWTEMFENAERLK